VKAKLNAGVSDKLTVTIERRCPLEGHCPAHRAVNGDVSHRVIKPGDTVRLQRDDTQVHEVLNVTTDYGPHLGRYSIRGKPRKLAAAMLVLDNRATRYVDADVQKICPQCRALVVDFGL
jgi:hypothetical protein